ncbi:hypothetical protein JOC55_002845 [Paenibacillus sacheonensis]|nr:hypothetical protein [Paenibacillus sacheonensis]
MHASQPMGGGTAEHRERTDIPRHISKRAECFNYEGSLPAYGLFARHVRGLSLHNVRIDTNGKPLTSHASINVVRKRMFNEVCEIPRDKV